VFAGEAEAALIRWLSGQPGPVLVQGDTATALAGARAAHFLGIPVHHIEAGIRTYDLTQPWPEEGFRTAITQLAAFHYAASEQNKVNLIEEGIHESVVLVTGNPGLDTLRLLVGDLLRERRPVDRCLVTLHRREALGEVLGGGEKDSGIGRIVAGLLAACGDHPHTEFIWPVHPNPEVKKALPAKEARPQNLILTDPIPHPEFAKLLARSKAVLTDSGGVQEEAAFLGVPCVVARKISDRPESLFSGHASLAGYDPDQIRTQLTQALRFGLLSTPFHGFGDGHAAARIVDHLASVL
jgi:UDP-N-acetylglucosamine 2-epimerase (non-hydrolysing)